MTAVPMTSDQLGQAQAIQTALDAAKTALQSASDQFAIMRTKSNTMMTGLKTTRPDAYNGAFQSKAMAVTLKGRADALLGETMQAHAEVSILLQQFFTDADSVVQAGPIR